MALSPAASPLHQRQGHALATVASLMAAIGTALLGAAAAPALAQAPSPNQPAAISPSTAPLKICPRLPPTPDSNLQPLQLKPEQVQRKNAMGCLSSADAIYGPDGCPLRRCTNVESLRRIQLPLTGPAPVGP